MSKRLKNYTAPDSIMEDFGADALRLYLITSGLVRGEEMKFADAGVKDMVRTALLPWYNSFKFFKTYAELDGWHPADHFTVGDNITDNWLISNLQTLKQTISREMEAYHLYNVVPALFTFIEDLTNTYIRLNRSRFWAEGLNEDKCAAYSTLYTALKELSMSMAPFAPFFSEHIYRELIALNPSSEEPISVHLCDYPVADESKINSILEAAVDRMNQIILLGRQKRNQVKIKVKTPLRQLTIIHKDKALLEKISKLENYIKSELNVETVTYDEDEGKYISLYSKPNFPVLGKRLGKDMGRFTGLIKKLTNEQLVEFDAKGSIEIQGQTFSKNEIEVLREAREGHDALSNSLITIDMDCNLDQTLINKGLAREVVSRIQKTRKDSNFQINDRIIVSYSASEELVSAITKNSGYIAKETLAEKLINTEVFENTVEFKIDNLELTISLKTV